MASLAYIYGVAMLVPFFLTVALLLVVDRVLNGRWKWERWRRPRRAFAVQAFPRITKPKRRKPKRVEGRPRRPKRHGRRK